MERPVHAGLRHLALHRAHGSAHASPDRGDEGSALDHFGLIVGAAGDVNRRVQISDFRFQT